MSDDLRQHSCDNCEGIDPDSCMTAPTKPPLADDLKKLIDDMSTEEKLLVLSYFSADREEFLFAAAEAKARFERADGYRSDKADDLRRRYAEAGEAAHRAWVGKDFADRRSLGDFLAEGFSAVRDAELATLRRTHKIQRDQIRAYVRAHQKDTARWSQDLAKAEAALAEATAKLDRLTTRGQIAGEEIELANRRLDLFQREMNEQSERAEKAEAKLAALDALHPHTELNWWHPCKNHSITDEEPTLAACPNCLIEPVMGCPRCGDDDCEIRAIIHPDSPKDATDD